MVNLKLLQVREDGWPQRAGLHEIPVTVLDLSDVDL